MCRPRTARGAGAGRTASTASNNSKQQQQQPPGEARGRGGNEMPRVPVERWFHGGLKIFLDAGEAALDRRDRLVAVACEFASFLEFVSTKEPC